MAQDPTCCKGRIQNARQIEYQEGNLVRFLGSIIPPTAANACRSKRRNGGGDTNDSLKSN